MPLPTTSCLAAAIPLLAALSPAQVDPVAIGRIYGDEFWTLDQAHVVGEIDANSGIDLLITCGGNKILGYRGEARLVDAATQSTFRTHLGDTPDDAFGFRATALGDVNLDGVGDYAISAPGHRFASGHRGYVRVFDGATGNAIADLRDSQRQIFGLAILGGHDLTGDGFPDLAVLTGRTSSIYVYDGMNLANGVAPAIHYTEVRYTEEMDLEHELHAMSDLDGDGISEVVHCTPISGDIHGSFSGNRIFTEGSEGFADMGDVDGDGIPDFAFGTSIPADGGGGGEDEEEDDGGITVWSGDLTVPTQLYYVPSNLFGNVFIGMGQELASMNDLDGDGVMELVAAGCGYNPSAETSNLWLISGATGEVLLETAHYPFFSSGVPTNGGPNPHMGNYLQAADVTGDGLHEVLVGAPHTHNNPGGGADLLRWTGCVLALSIAPGDPGGGE